MPIKMSAACKQLYLKDSINDDKLPQNADPSKYNYSARHPAHKLVDQYGWNVFYTKLQKEIESQKSLKIIKDSIGSTPYQLCNYGSDQFSKWNEYTIICRGLIVDKKAKEIIASPFPKFFNYGQYHQNIQQYISNQFQKKKDVENDENDEEKKQNEINVTDDKHGVFEKVDGSLGICFYCKYNKQWRIVTRGHFGSPQAQWAMNYVEDKRMDKSLHKGHTYLFEIIYKSNQIGVNYGNFEGLILLHAYNQNGYEYKYEYLQFIANKLKFKVATCYKNKYQNIDDLLAAQKTIDKNKEGFVLCLANGFRIKFKGEEYLKMIKNKHGSSPTAIKKGIKAKMIVNGVLNKSDLLSKYEDEFHDEISKIYDEIYNDLLQRTQDCVHDLIMTNHLSKNQLNRYKQKLNNNVQFIGKARKVCDQNLWKSYLGKKSNKGMVGKVVNRITDELLYEKEWRMFIMKGKK